MRGLASVLVELRSDLLLGELRERLAPGRGRQGATTRSLSIDPFRVRVTGT